MQCTQIMSQRVFVGTKLVNKAHGDFWEGYVPIELENVIALLRTMTSLDISYIICS